MGDFNVDLLNPDSDNDYSNFYNSLSSHVDQLNTKKSDNDCSNF